MKLRKPTLKSLIAALCISSAAMATEAQSNRKANSVPTPGKDKSVKANREVTQSASPVPKGSSDSVLAEYQYEFNKAEFVIPHILIKYDSTGRGQITFTRTGEDQPISEPLELSAPALTRINTLWSALNFLDSTRNYQSERQYPQLGVIQISMRQGARHRVAEFNWTNDPAALSLVKEFRRLSDQEILLFDISVARDNEPLETPRLLDRMDDLIRGSGIEDPGRVGAILRDLSSDERLPLIARNHADRMAKRLAKQS